MADLKDLVEHSVAFKETLEQKLDNQDLRQKAMTLTNQNEIQEMRDLTHELAVSGMSAIFGGLDDDFLKLNLKAANTSIGLSARVMPDDEIVNDIPDALIDVEAIAQLESLGASNIVALCKHKMKE